MLQNTMKNIETLYKDHQGNVSDKWELFLREYDRLFSAYREKPVHLLEIGVQNGGSLAIWGQYFTHAEKIIGCDVNPDCQKISYSDSKIELIIGDVTNKQTFETINNKSPAFDIIIDDGSHTSVDIVKTFCLYFPALNDAGIFIVEDLHCSYWNEYSGGLYNPLSSVAFFKALTDVLNSEHWGFNAKSTDVLQSFFNEYDCTISEKELGRLHSIEFINSLCVIRKKPSDENVLGPHCIAGQIELVVPGHLELQGQCNIPPDQSTQVCSIAPEEDNKNYIDALCQMQEQICELNIKLSNQEGQLSSLRSQLKHKEKVCDEILNSKIWLLGYPLRQIGTYIKRLFAYIRFFQKLISSIGFINIVNKTKNVYATERMRGIKFRVKNIVSIYKVTGEIYNRRNIENEGAESFKLNEELNEGPTISVIMAVYKTPVEMLVQAIESVISQTYKKWELVIVNDYSQSEEIDRILFDFTQQDNRIKYISLEENKNISAANNVALETLSGSFFTVLDHDDLLSQHALNEIAIALQDNPELDYIYSDEDKVSKDGSTLFGPFFKPDWSPEYLLAMMYTCHMSVFRTELVRSLGGYDSNFDSSQDYELLLRVLLKTDKVYHIPKLLYHWRVWENSTAQSIDAKPLAIERSKKALENFLSNKEENFSISEGPLPGHFSIDFYPKKNSLVSIVIPTANGEIEINGKVEKHINSVCESIIKNTNYKNYEVIIVHNGDLYDSQLSWFNSVSYFKLVQYDSPVFSLSEKINLGAAHSKGEYLLILNDDVRVISPDWLTLMLGMVQREGVGVVGPKLLFPDQTIQHAGVVLLGGLPGHPYYQDQRNSQGYALGLQVNRNYLAVTGACCITPKWLFERIGGYSNEYPLNYNDVDYCIKAHKLGYRSVYLANVELYHYEGVSKEGGRSVRSEEIQHFLDDWGKEFTHDPYYNIHLNQFVPYK